MNWIDNPVTRALGRLCDLAVLNILWLVCCIPIVTIGASTSALYSVMLKFVRNEEGYIVKGFLKGFKENFKKSTIIWLIMVALGIIVVVDLWAISSMHLGALDILFRGALIFVGFMVLCVSVYALPMTARYENTIKQTLKNSVILSVAKLPYTILMCIVSFGPIIIAFLDARLMVLGMLVGVMIGEAAVAWVNSHFLRKIFTIFEPEEGMESAGAEATIEVVETVEKIAISENE